MKPYGQYIKCEPQIISFPPQHQDVQPGIEAIMDPRPIFDNPNYKGSEKLKS